MQLSKRMIWYFAVAEIEEKTFENEIVSECALIRQIEKPHTLAFQF